MKVLPSMRMLPEPVQVAVAALRRVRCVRTLFGVSLMASEPLAAMIVWPVPLMVPPRQVSKRLTVMESEPVPFEIK